MSLNPRESAANELLTRLLVEKTGDGSLRVTRIRPGVAAGVVEVWLAPVEGGERSDRPVIVKDTGYVRGTSVFDPQVLVQIAEHWPEAST